MPGFLTHCPIIALFVLAIEKPLGTNPSPYLIV